MSTNGKADILGFRELERVSADDSDVIVYEAMVHKSVFAYLYLNPMKYALAWNSPGSFEFDGRQPFTFIEELLSSKSALRVEYMDLILPPPRPKHPESSIRQKGFCYDRSTGTLVLANGDQDLREYDLLNDEDRADYLSVLQDRAIKPSIAFARYDSSIRSAKFQFSCCFTLEPPSDATNGEWEFALNLPRSVPLSERALKWIVKHHWNENLKQAMNFELSLASLSQILNQRM